MAKFLTTFVANKVIDSLRGVTWTPPATLTLALYTTAPTVAGGGTKVTGGSYADQSVTLSAAASSASSNSNTITFVNLPTCTIAAAALLDGVSGDVLWVQDSLSISVTAGDNKVVQIGDLDVSFIAA